MRWPTSGHTLSAAHRHGVAHPQEQGADEGHVAAHIFAALLTTSGSRGVLRPHGPRRTRSDLLFWSHYHDATLKQFTYQ